MVGMRENLFSKWFYINVAFLTAGMMIGLNIPKTATAKSQDEVVITKAKKNKLPPPPSEFDEPVITVDSEVEVAAATKSN